MLFWYDKINFFRYLILGKWKGIKIKQLETDINNQKFFSETMLLFPRTSTPELNEDLITKENVMKKKNEQSKEKEEHFNSIFKS